MTDQNLTDFLDRLRKAAKGTFWDYLGATLDLCSPEQVVVSLDIRPHHLNFLGILHGGVYAALIDSAMGLAAMAAKPGDSVVTTNLNLHFVAPVEQGIVRVYAEVVHVSRKSVTTQAYARNGSGGLCAFGTGTFRVVDRPAPAERNG